MHGSRVGIGGSAVRPGASRLVWRRAYFHEISYIDPMPLLSSRPFILSALFVFALAAPVAVGASTPPAAGAPPTEAEGALRAGSLQPIITEGDFKDSGSGLTFPQWVGPFWRARLARGANDALVASYAIERADYPVIVNIAVHDPVPMAATADRAATGCPGQFVAAKEAVLMARPQAVIIEDGTRPSPFAGERISYRAVYEFSDQFAGKARALRSELDLFCLASGGRLLKVRATSPVDVDASGHVRRLLARLARSMPAAGDDAGRGPPAPDWPDPIIVRVQGYRAPLILLGVIASGPEKAVAAFERFADARGFAGDRSTDDSGKLSSLVVLPMDGDQNRARGFWRDARAGKAGAAVLEAAVVDMRGALAGQDLSKMGFAVPIARVAGP